MVVLSGMKKHVLIIEDEKDMREALAAALTAADFEVTTADNGATGLQTALAEKPDVILLDLLMPVMGGQEMLAKLRLDDWGKTAKVIMATALDDVQNVDAGFEGGILDYIVKSNMSLSEIVKVVQGVAT